MRPYFFVFGNARTRRLFRPFRAPVGRASNWNREANGNAQRSRKLCARAPGFARRLNMCIAVSRGSGVSLGPCRNLFVAALVMLEYAGDLGQSAYARVSWHRHTAGPFSSLFGGRPVAAKLGFPDKICLFHASKFISRF